MKEKRKIFEAINTLADFLGQEPSAVISKVSFLDKEVSSKLISVYNDTIHFYELPLEERLKISAQENGYTYEKTEKGFEISTVL